MVPDHLTAHSSYSCIDLVASRRDHRTLTLRLNEDSFNLLTRTIGQATTAHELPRCPWHSTLNADNTTFVADDAIKDRYLGVGLA